MGQLTFIIDHCANCLERRRCDQARKGRFCPAFVQDPAIASPILRQATEEDKAMKFTIKVNFAPAPLESGN